MSAMGKSFNVWAVAARNDFRADRSGHADARSPAVIGGPQPGEFVYAWRENRAGHFDVYVRA
jgi:hypothetical protein